MAMLNYQRVFCSSILSAENPHGRGAIDLPRLQEAGVVGELALHPRIAVGDPRLRCDRFPFLERKKGGECTSWGQISTIKKHPLLKTWLMFQISPTSPTCKSSPCFPHPLRLNIGFFLALHLLFPPCVPTSEARSIIWIARSSVSCREISERDKRCYRIAGYDFSLCLYCKTPPKNRKHAYTHKQIYIYICLCMTTHVYIDIHT